MMVFAGWLAFLERFVLALAAVWLLHYHLPLRCK
jgi:hypothetical protein